MICNSSFPIINAIADSYKYAFASVTFLDEFYESVKKQPYCTRERSSFSEMDRDKGIDYVYECCQKPLFVQTKEVSERQKRQRGAYILFPNDIVDTKPRFYFRDEIKEINKYGKHVYKRIRIKKDFKLIMKKQLAILGINEGYLFGDSVDSICKQIKDDFPTNW